MRRRRRIGRLTGYCHNCKEIVTGQQIDMGIGWYEAWGHRAFDTHIIIACQECETELEDVQEDDPY